MSPMIIVKFKGGLGNQMLQYAMYLTLKRRYPKSTVLADLSQYNMIPVHNGFELDKIFFTEIQTLIADKRTSNLFVKKYIFGWLPKAISYLIKTNLFGVEYIKQTKFFNPQILNLNSKKNYFIEGYWGSPKYFESVQEELLSKHFIFKQPLDYSNQKLYNDIQNINSVSVHVRRGDYLITGIQFVDLASSDYYRKAVNYINSKTENPCFFIFSDDPEWCKKNLEWFRQYKHVYVNNNKNFNSFKDMQLMSICKHNIIANSTFSWWASILNNNKKKLVIAPKKVFNDEIRNAKEIEIFYPDYFIKF